MRSGCHIFLPAQSQRGEGRGGLWPWVPCRWELHASVLMRRRGRYPWGQTQEATMLPSGLCACSPFCGKWGVCARSHEPANAPTSVCLGVWLWVCTQTYGTKPQQTQSARCEFPLKGKPGGWGCSSSSQDVQFQAACSLGRIQGKGQPGPTHESVRVCVCDLGPLLVCRCQAGCPALFLDFLSLCLSQNFRGGGGGGLATCLCVPVSSEAWEGLSLHCSPVRLVAGPLGCPSVCM